MKRNATPSEAQSRPVEQSKPKFPPFRKVFDGRRRRIRGLWVRNERFYARLSVIDPDTGRHEVRRVPLEGVHTVPEAQAELRRLMTQREEGTLGSLRRTPKFTDYVQQYLAYYDVVKDAKRPKTVACERSVLGQWVKHLGETRLDRITPAMINAFIAKRQGEGVCGRTVNLAMNGLRNVLKKGIADGWLKRLPTETIKPLKWTPPKRELVTLEQINAVCEAAKRVCDRGQQFADYVRLMTYCGSRMSETLRLKWSDVDWERGQLTVGADGLAKNHRSRVVDFNPALEAHLKELASRRAADSGWLFPSPLRGDQDEHAKALRKMLPVARQAAGLAKFGFHDCRHHFISMCVMSGIDYMTIAKWVGHRDGGVLIGKVYGHLCDEHAKRQAQRVVFGPTVLAAAQAS